MMRLECFDLDDTTLWYVLHESILRLVYLWILMHI